MSVSLKTVFPVLLGLMAQATMALGTLHFVSGNVSDDYRINIVFVGDGYTQSQEDQFLSDVRTASTGVFNTPPYKEYANLFNVFAIFVPSKESGADKPLQNIYKDTYFNATFGKETERLVTVNSAKVFDEVIALVPEYNSIVVIVNDPQYGGSGGAISVATASSSAIELVLHEMGHSFAALADEYDTPYGITPYETHNATAQLTREKIRWRNWISSTTPLPTPKTTSYKQSVGAFEGAIYQPTGWYRPMQVCKMRELGSPFCPVCAETHVAKFRKLVPPLLEAFPPPDTLVYTGKGTTQIDLKIRPASGTVKTNWYLNDNLAASGSVLHLGDLNLNQSYKKLKVIVRDTTLLVRNDSIKNLLTDSLVWYIKKEVPVSLKPIQDRSAFLSWRKQGSRRVLHLSSRFFIPKSESGQVPRIAQVTGRIYTAQGQYLGLPLVWQAVLKGNIVPDWSLTLPEQSLQNLCNRQTCFLEISYRTETSGQVGSRQSHSLLLPSL